MREVLDGHRELFCRPENDIFVIFLVIFLLIFSFFGRVASHLLLFLFSFLVTVIFLLFFLFFGRVAVLCFCRWHILAGGHSAKSKQHTKCCTDRRAKRCTDRRTERRTDLVAVIVKYLSCTQNRLATLSYCNKNEHSTHLDAKTIRNRKFRVGSAQQLYHRWRLRICGTVSVGASFGRQKPFKFIGVPGVVSLLFPSSRPACPALRVAGRPVRLSLTLARWYAIPRGLCVPRARSGCPSGCPRLPSACVCARTLAAPAPPSPGWCGVCTSRGPGTGRW